MQINKTIMLMLFVITMMIGLSTSVHAIVDVSYVNSVPDNPTYTYGMNCIDSLCDKVAIISTYTGSVGIMYSIDGFSSYDVKNSSVSAGNDGYDINVVGDSLYFSDRLTNDLAFLFKYNTSDNSLTNYQNASNWNLTSSRVLWFSTDSIGNNSWFIIGGSPNTLYYSSDIGITASESGTLLNTANDGFKVSSTGQYIVVASIPPQLSSDYGVSFTNLTGYNGGYFVRLSLSGQHILLTDTSDLSYSNDYGNSFTNVPYSSINFTTDPFGADISDDGQTIVVIGTDYSSTNEIAYSQDGGTTWNVETLSLGTFSGDWESVTLSPDGSKGFFAGFGDTNIDIYKFTIPSPCTENWIANDTVCNGVNYTIQYYDNNVCGTYNDLPIDNGTVVSCSYPLTGLVAYNQQVTQDLNNTLIPITLILLVSIVGLVMLANFYPQLNKTMYIIAGIIGVVLIILVIVILVNPLSLIT